MGSQRACVVVIVPQKTGAQAQTPHASYGIQGNNLKSL